MKQFILIISILAITASCSKNSNDSNFLQQQQSQVQIPSATMTWVLSERIASVPSIKFTIKFNIPDNGTIKSVSLFLYSPKKLISTISNPKTGSVTVYHHVDMPRFDDYHYYYFEWTMTNGSKIESEKIHVH